MSNIYETYLIKNTDKSKYIFFKFIKNSTLSITSINDNINYENIVNNCNQLDKKVNYGLLSIKKCNVDNLIQIKTNETSYAPQYLLVILLDKDFNKEKIIEFEFTFNKQINKNICNIFKIHNDINEHQIQKIILEYKNAIFKDNINKINLTDKNPKNLNNNRNIIKKSNFFSMRF